MTSHDGVSSGTTGVLTREKVSRLLRPMLINPFIWVEEERHPWSVKASQELTCPLLRIWDFFSGSQPDDDSRMLSRAREMELSTKEARKESLSAHLNHSNWGTATPYITFTILAESVAARANMRIQRRRGSQKLTVVNPISRLRNGLPILNVTAEMDYYVIPGPYRVGNRYYIDHYVCLWEINAEEIVGEWGWAELALNENWYEDVIMPAFNRFREGKALCPAPTSASVATAASTFEMSAFMETLSGQS